MSFNTSSSSPPANKERKTAEALLLESMLPGLVTGDTSGKVTNKARAGAIGDYVSGGGDLSAFNPSPESLRVNTVFDQFDAGTLSPSGSQLFSSSMNTATNPNLTTDFLNSLNPQSLLNFDAERQLAGEALSGFGGISGGSMGSIGGGTGDIPNPDIPALGQLTSQMMADLPPQMQQFINNIFEDSSPEAIDRELDNFSQAMLAESERNVDTLGRSVMSQFGAAGLGTSGAAIQEMKQLALDATINLNAQIAGARLQMLDTLITARQVGVQLTGVLLQAGAAEQANIVQQNVARIDAASRIATAKIQAQTAVQQSLIDANARIQTALIGETGATQRALIGEQGATRRSLIDSATNIQLGQLGFQQNAFNTLANQQFAQSGSAREDQLIPLNTMLALATSTPLTGSSSKSSGFDAGLGDAFQFAPIKIPGT